MTDGPMAVTPTPEDGDRFGPTTEQIAVAKLVDSLRALDDDQLEVLLRRVRHRSMVLFGDADPDDTPTPKDTFTGRANPVNRVEFALEGLVCDEVNRRASILDPIEAEMTGGHLVVVSCGDNLTMYAATCDPRPDTERFCWIGPDRAEFEDAVADGRSHNPGYEPTISRLLGRDE